MKQLTELEFCREQWSGLWLFVQGWNIFSPTGMRNRLVSVKLGFLRGSDDPCVELAEEKWK